MEIGSRSHKGFDVLANLLHFRHARAEAESASAEEAEAMDDDLYDPDSCEDEWDEDDDE
ncbi:MAG: hypothetical protein IJ507_05835 [Clostridia bacterium]|nr:hypothetical protein [Clostridia bacterium]